MSAKAFRLVDLNDPATSGGMEVMVVKPLDFISKGRRRVAQPAIKPGSRVSSNHLPLPEKLERQRAGGVGGKRSLASREFALGVGALERFVRKEPLRHTHECVFGVLAHPYMMVNRGGKYLRRSV